LTSNPFMVHRRVEGVVCGVQSVDGSSSQRSSRFGLALTHPSTPYATLGAGNIKLRHFGRRLAPVELCSKRIAFRRSAPTGYDCVTSPGQSGCGHHAEPTRCAGDQYSLLHRYDLPLSSEIQARRRREFDHFSCKIPKPSRADGKSWRWAVSLQSWAILRAFQERMNAC
jgi:hypothetical protein